MQVAAVNSVNFRGPGFKPVFNKAARGRVEVEESSKAAVKDIIKFGKDINTKSKEVADTLVSIDRSIKPKTRKSLFTTNK